jgi:hypothetical protein
MVYRLGLLGCGQGREGPLMVEGKLLLGHALQVRWVRGRPANRSQASTGAAADYRVRPSPESER